ncbi:hypothetical protein [Halonotius sp. GCM10025705]|uniref:hypothetical protein n=1 Tax=Halonotius sp. GCM10025705 TaxID=3252678 RepID=UPI00361B0E2A
MNKLLSLLKTCYRILRQDKVKALLFLSLIFVIIPWDSQISATKYIEAITNILVIYLTLLIPIHLGVFLFANRRPLDIYKDFNWFDITAIAWLLITPSIIPFFVLVFMGFIHWMFSILFIIFWVCHLLMTAMIFAFAEKEAQGEAPISVFNDLK